MQPPMYFSQGWIQQLFGGLFLILPWLKKLQIFAPNNWEKRCLEFFQEKQIFTLFAQLQPWPKENFA